MRAFIDAPLFIYLNAVERRELRFLYEEFYLEILAGYRAYTDVLVLDEVIYMSKKKYGIPYEISMRFIGSSVLPYVTLISLGEVEYRYAMEVMEVGLRPSDALHVGAMRSSGINLIISEDRDFDRIEGIKRIWMN